MSHQQNPHSNSNLLNIRFVGRTQKSRSIPIYELSKVLEAIQRIINKAYVFNERGVDGLLRGATLKVGQRQGIALEISEHEKGFGYFSLKPFAVDIPEIELLEYLVKNAITAMNFYSEEGQFRQKYSNGDTRRRFKKLIKDSFKESELKELCYDLGINYDELSGSTKTEKILELIDFMKRHKRISELLTYCKKERANVEWNFYAKELEIAISESGDPHELQLLAATIFSEVEKINQRIRNIGGIEKIEISSPLHMHMKCLFNVETKKGIRDISDEAIELQETKELEGNITTLFLTTFTAILRDHTGNKIKLYLKYKDFEAVRNYPEQHPLVIIKGYPIYRFGLEQFTEMSVKSLKFVNPVNDGSQTK